MKRIFSFILLLSFLHIHSLRLGKASTLNQIGIVELDKKTDLLASGLDEGQIDVISYNVWGLQPWLLGVKRKKRYPKMIDHLNFLDAKIVGLQECFDEKFRKYLLDTMKDTYTTKSNYLCNDGPSYFKKDCHGGLVTLSQYPILEEKFYPYKKKKGMSLDDKIGKKGFLLSKIKTPQGNLNVINTHLNAGSKKVDFLIRYNQFKEIKHVLDSLNLYEEPMVLMGDLNSLNPHISSITKEQAMAYEFITGEGKFKDADIDFSPDKPTYDGEQNRFTQLWLNRTRSCTKLDYVLYFSPEKEDLVVEEHEVIFKDEHTCSDHYGIYAKFSMNSGDVTGE